MSLNLRPLCELSSECNVYVSHSHWRSRFLTSLREDSVVLPAYQCQNNCVAGIPTCATPFALSGSKFPPWYSMCTVCDLMRRRSFDTYVYDFSASGGTNVTGNCTSGAAQEVVCIPTHEIYLSDTGAWYTLCFALSHRSHRGEQSVPAVRCVWVDRSCCCVPRLGAVCIESKDPHLAWATDHHIGCGAVLSGSKIATYPYRARLSSLSASSAPLSSIVRICSAT